MAKYYERIIVIIVIYLSLSVPAILREAVPATTQNVQVEIQNTTKLAFTYTGKIYDFYSGSAVLHWIIVEQFSGVVINFFFMIYSNNRRDCHQPETVRRTIIKFAERSFDQHTATWSFSFHSAGKLSSSLLPSELTCQLKDSVSSFSFDRMM